MAKQKRINQHFRELPSSVFDDSAHVPDEFREFAADKVMPHLELSGYKIEQQRELAVRMLHSLAMTVSGSCVSDARSTAIPGAKLRTKVWDAIEDAGYSNKCIGSKDSAKRTLYRGSGQLLRLKTVWERNTLMDIRLGRNTELAEPTMYALVVFHTGKIDLVTGLPLPDEKRRKPISIKTYCEANAQPGDDGKPDPQAIANGIAELHRIEDKIDAINRNNLEHSWLAYTVDPETGRKYAFQPNPCLRQIHAGTYYRAVRLYSWSTLSGQNLSRATRQTMLIDGEKVAELDFSCLHPRMAYHAEHRDPKGDIYRPEKVFPKFYKFKNSRDDKKAIARDFVKHCTNICLNVASRSRANSSVGKLLAEHPESKFLTDLVYNTEGIDPADVVQRIEAAHPRIKHKFFTEHGLTLMTHDGLIMLHMLTAFEQARKPVLGIHDSLVVRASDVEFAKETMSATYHEFMHYEPVIRQVY